MTETSLKSAINCICCGDGVQGNVLAETKETRKYRTPEKNIVPGQKMFFFRYFLLFAILQSAIYSHPRLQFFVPSIISLPRISFPKRDPVAGLKIALYFISFAFSPCLIVYLFKALCKFCIDHFHNMKRSHNSVYSRSISSTIKGYSKHFQNYRFERASSFYPYCSTVNEIKFVENDREPGLWIYSTLWTPLADRSSGCIN